MYNIKYYHFITCDLHFITHLWILVQVSEQHSACWEPWQPNLCLGNILHVWDTESRGWCRRLHKHPAPTSWCHPWDLRSLLLHPELRRFLVACQHTESPHQDYNSAASFTSKVAQPRLCDKCSCSYLAWFSISLWISLNCLLTLTIGILLTLEAWCSK